MGEHLKQCQVITRLARMQVPSDQRLASRSVANSPDQPGGGNLEREGTSAQAALLNPEMCMVRIPAKSIFVSRVSRPSK